MPKTPSGLILPEQGDVVQVDMKQAMIGGVPLDYNADPRIALALPRNVFANPDHLLGLLSAQINIQNALIREIIDLRARLGISPDGTQAAPAEEQEPQDIEDADGAEADEELEAAAQG